MSAFVVLSLVPLLPRALLFLPWSSLHFLVVWTSLSSCSVLLCLVWVERLTHIVNYDCLALQMDTKNWLERFEIKNKLHPTNRKTRKPLFVEHMSFRFHGQVFNLRCRTNSWIKTEKNLLIFREDQYLHCLWEWKLRLHVQCFKRIEFFFISLAVLCGQMCFVWAMWACQERIMLER